MLGPDDVQSPRTDLRRSSPRNKLHDERDPDAAAIRRGRRHCRRLGARSIQTWPLSRLLRSGRPDSPPGLGDVVPMMTAPSPDVAPGRGERQHSLPEPRYDLRMLGAAVTVNPDRPGPKPTALGDDELVDHDAHGAAWTRSWYLSRILNASPRVHRECSDNRHMSGSLGTASSLSLG